jgi:hypothetical protein
MVVEVSYYVELTPDGLLRHVVYLGEREDTSATEVRRPRLGFSAGNAAPPEPAMSAGGCS